MFKKLFLMPGFLAVLLSIIIPSAAFAHKVKIFALMEADEIYGYVYFSGGRRAKEVLVSLEDSSGKVIKELNTNKKGEFRFSKIGMPPYKISTDIGDGHSAEYVISETIPQESLTIQTLYKNKDISHEKQPSQQPAQDLKRVIEKAVAGQITPLRVQLEAYEEKIRIRDIIGAIGYIIGLFGLFFFFKAGSRRT